MKLIKRFKLTTWIVIATFIIAIPLVWARTPKQIKFGLRLADEGAAPDTPPSGYGELYVNSDNLCFKNDSGTVVTVTAGAGDNTLDNAYDQGGAGSGKAVTVDNGAIALSNTDADTAWILTINASPSSSAALGGLQITNGANSSQDALEFANSGTGYDIYGTGGTWTASKAGALTASSLTVTTLTATTLYNSAIASASSGNTNLTIDAAGSGTITVGGTSTGKVTTDNAVELFGAVDIGDAATDTLTITSIIDDDVTLDDGTTDSPKLIFKDSDDEQAEIYQDQSSDDLNVECHDASDSLAVTVGNLSAGTPAVSVITLNGGDLFVADDAEIDGTLAVDTDLDVNGSADISGALALSENVTFTMAADEYLKLDADTTAMTQTAGAIDINLKTGATNVKAIHIDLEADDTFANAYGLYIDVDDDGSGGEETVDCIYLANSAGTASTVNGIQLANTLDVGIDAVCGAAEQLMVVDATTTPNTGTSGVIDINYRTATTTAHAINLDVESDVAGGASEAVYGLKIQLDDDSNTASDSLSAIYIGTDGNGTGLQYGLNVVGSGIDAGVYLQNGYLRVGTGETPGQELGDDDSFMEGHLEVDGTVYFDGDQIVGDGSTEMVGVNHDVVDGGATNPYTVTIAMAGTVFYNSEAIEFDLPEASTAIGCEYTFVVQHASELHIDPEASDKILGATDSAGDRIHSSTVGDTVTLICIDATNWVVKAAYPASTDWPDADA